MSTSTTAIFWDVEYADRYVGVPSDYNPRNKLDAHGSLLDLPRLPNETGPSYYKRLMSVFPQRAGAHQIGLVHGLTRELGLEEVTALKITPQSQGSLWKARAPHIDITSTKIILYREYYGEDHESNVIDLELDIYSHDGCYLLQDILDQVGSSDFFSIELGDDVTGAEKSNGLIQSSSGVVTNEFIPPAKYFVLQNDDIIENSISFSDKTTFRYDVSPEAFTNPDDGITVGFSVNSEVGDDGEYFVNYNAGIVIVYTAPNGAGTCRYIYRDLPWRARWSPIVVYSLRDSEYREKLFEVEDTVLNTEEFGLVNDDGSQIYAELFRVSPCLWGK